MSDVERKPVTEIGVMEETAQSPSAKRDLEVFEQDALRQQAFLTKEINDREQLIAAHYNKMTLLDKKLDEVLNIRQDLADGFENLRKLIETQGLKHAEWPSMTKKCSEDFIRLSELVEQHLREVAKLTNMKTELADDCHNLNKWVKQQAHQPTRRSDIIGGKDVVEPPLEIKETELTVPAEVIDEDTAELKSDINSVVLHLEQAFEKTVTNYKHKLRNNEQTVESMRNELKSLNDTVADKNKTLVQFCEQIENQKAEIINLTKHVENVRAMDEEINNLKNLLKLANEKLDERWEKLKQLDKVPSNAELLNKPIFDSKVNETSQLEGVPSVESMQFTMSSLSDKVDHRIHVAHASARKTDEEIVEMKNELPGYLSRLQKLYKPMTERLSAKSVARYLFQKDVLSLASLEAVQCSRTTPTEAAACLLKQLLNRCSEVSYNCFLTALTATDQEQIFLWLTDDNYEIECQHIDLLREKSTYLVEHINPTGSGLITMLFQEKVIDLEEKEYIEYGEGAVRQVERLLSVLHRKSKKRFEEFLVVLVQTGHSYVADELRRTPSVDAAIRATAVVVEFICLMYMIV